MKKVCPKCDGARVTGPYACSMCNGQGTVITYYHCWGCGWTGSRTDGGKCPSCFATDYLNERRD